MLKEQPVWVLVMRNDPLALANQVDAFELTYRKLLVSETHCRNVSIALCVLFFPVGLLTLVGNNTFGIRPKPMRLAAALCLVLSAVSVVGLLAATISNHAVILLPFFLPFVLLHLLLLVRSCLCPCPLLRLSSPFILFYLSKVCAVCQPQEGGASATGSADARHDPLCRKAPYSR